MRALVTATLAFVLLGGGSSHAQSLEKTYADLCSDAAKARSESCVALAQALVAKLQGQVGASTAAPTPNPAPATLGKSAAEPAGNERWGFYADLVDVPLSEILVENPLEHEYKPVPVIVKYVWDVPGEVLGVMSMQANGTFQKGKTLRWDGARRGLIGTAIADSSQKELLEWQPDGSFVLRFEKAFVDKLVKIRYTYRRLPGGAIEVRRERDDGQGWLLLAVHHLVKATPDDYAHGGGASQPDSRVWGPLAKLVGTTWSQASRFRSGGAGTVSVHKFAWTEDGAAIEFTNLELRKTARIIFRSSDEPGVLLAQVKLNGEKEANTHFRFGDDGVLRSDWYKIGSWDRRERIVVTENGRYYSDFMGGRRGAQPDFSPVSDPLLSIYERYVGPHYLQMLAKERREFEAYDDEKNRRYEAKREQEKRIEKAERSSQRAQMFGAVLQGLAQGAAEANTGGYAEAQADLDATVANIQYAAAAERQQQNSSQNGSPQQPQAGSAPQAKEESSMEGSPARFDSSPNAQPRPTSTAATQQESKCSEAPGFRKVLGYAEKTRESAMRSMMETPHLEPLQDVSCTQPPNLGYTLEGWWKCTAMAPTGLMVKHCPQSNSGVSSQ